MERLAIHADLNLHQMKEWHLTRLHTFGACVAIFSALKFHFRRRRFRLLPSWSARRNWTFIWSRDWFRNKRWFGSNPLLGFSCSSFTSYIRHWRFNAPCSVVQKALKRTRVLFSLAMSFRLHNVYLCFVFSFFRRALSSECDQTMAACYTSLSSYPQLSSSRCIV